MNLRGILLISLLFFNLQISLKEASRMLEDFRTSILPVSLIIERAEECLQTAESLNPVERNKLYKVRLSNTPNDRESTASLSHSGSIAYYFSTLVKRAMRRIRHGAYAVELIFSTRGNKYIVATIRVEPVVL